MEDPRANAPEETDKEQAMRKCAALNLALVDCYDKGNRFTNTCYDEYSAFWACYKAERGFIKARSIGDLLSSKE